MTTRKGLKYLLVPISIHILHTKDDSKLITDIIAKEFQSTSFIRRMTWDFAELRRISAISIHILHTKDDSSTSYGYTLCMISIHILHTKDDIARPKVNIRFSISIHILHTKDDWVFRVRLNVLDYFNPHPSYEG